MESGIWIIVAMGSFFIMGYILGLAKRRKRVGMCECGHMSVFHYTHAEGSCSERVVINGMVFTCSCKCFARAKEQKDSKSLQVEALNKMYLEKSKEKK